VAPKSRSEGRPVEHQRRVHGVVAVENGPRLRVHDDDVSGGVPEVDVCPSWDLVNERPMVVGRPELKSASLLREYIPTRITTDQRREFLAGLLSCAEWEGSELSMDCFIGAKVVTTCWCL